MVNPASRALRLLGLGALLAFAAGAAPALVPAAQAATAAVPVVLPAGQSAEEWNEALAARGLVAAKGLANTGPGVVIVDQRDYWELVVRDRKGQTQKVNVAPAASASEREDLLFYVSTLLGPAPEEPVVATAPPPVAVPPPVASAPPVAAPPAAPPATTSAPAASAPATTAPAASAPAPIASAPTTAATAQAPAAPTGGVGFWINGGAGVGIRSEAGVVGDFRADAGWHVLPSVRVGVGLSGRTAAPLTVAGAGNEMRDLDVVAEGAWVAAMRYAPVVGVYGGVSARTFVVDGAAVTDAMIPILGGEVGLQIPLGSLPIHLEPSARLQGDLREVQLVTDTGTSTLAPIEVRAALMVGWRAR